MQIDFNSLSEAQINLIIDRLCTKFNDCSIDLVGVSNIISLYRKNRFDIGCIKLIEGDELLKGIVYRKPKTKPLETKIEPIKGTPISKPIVETKDDFNDLDGFEKDEFDLHLVSMNRLRAGGTGKLNRTGSETEKTDIVLDNNIEQRESEFLLHDINKQLPAENLLDKFNLGFVDLHDDDFGVNKESIGKRIRLDSIKKD